MRPQEYEPEDPMAGEFLGGGPLCVYTSESFCMGAHVRETRNRQCNTEPVVYSCTARVVPICASMRVLGSVRPDSSAFRISVCRHPCDLLYVCAVQLNVMPTPEVSYVLSYIVLQKLGYREKRRNWKDCFSVVGSGRMSSQFLAGGSKDPDQEPWSKLLASPDDNWFSRWWWCSSFGLFYNWDPQTCFWRHQQGHRLKNPRAAQTASKDARRVYVLV